MWQRRNLLTPSPLLHKWRRGILFVFLTRVGPRDTERQARFRDLATRQTIRQRERSPYVRKWGTDGGFLGRGRIVDFQLGAAL